MNCGSRETGLLTPAPVDDLEEVDGEGIVWAFPLNLLLSKVGAGKQRKIEMKGMGIFLPLPQ